MRYIIFLVLSFISFPVFAWSMIGATNDPSFKSEKINYYVSRGYVVRAMPWSVDGWTLHFGSALQVTESDLQYELYGFVYTDSQCGDGYTSSGQVNTFDNPTAACISEPTTDEQCLALNDDYGDKMTMITDSDPSGLTWAGVGSSAGCEFRTVPGVSVEVGGKWHSKFEATGAVEDLSGSTDPLDLSGPEAPEGGELAPSEDYTETTDSETDCQFSNVSFGETTYCYSGTHAPEDVSYPDGTIRVDNPDGSFDVVVTDPSTGTQTVTEYNADGSLKSPGSAPTTGSGDDYAGDDDGIISAINAMKRDISDKFDSLVEDLTTEVDNAANFAAMDDAVDGYEGTVANDDTNIVEEFDNQVGEQQGQSIINMLPTFSGGFSCSDISFDFGERSMIISCDKFAIFRDMFAFILYVYTAFSIADVFFNSSRQKVS